MSASARAVFGASLLGALLLSGSAFASSHREAPAPHGARTADPANAPAVTVRRPGYVAHPTVTPTATPADSAAPKAPAAPAALAAPAAPVAPAAPASK